jgi:hypothetical protein
MTWITAVQSSNETAAWWGVPLIAGSFGVIGALAGVLVNFLTTRSSERRATAREDRLRWIRDLRDVGAELVSRCHDIEDAALLLHKSREPGREPLSPFRRDALYGQMSDARRAIVHSTALVALLAPDDIVNKAHEVLTFATELGLESEETAYEYSEIQIDYSEAVADFIFILREHLGAGALT